MMAFNASETFKPFMDPTTLFKDFQGKWTDMLENFTGGFKAGEKPFQWDIGSRMEQAEKGMDAIINMVPIAETTKRDMLDRCHHACLSYRKVYEKYMDLSSELAQGGLQANQTLMKGKPADMIELYDAAMDAVKDMASCMADCLTDTPFESLKSLDRTLKKSLSSLSKEEKQAKEIIAEMISLNEKIAKVYASGAKHPAFDFEKKKEIDVGAVIGSFGSIADAVAETQKRMAEILSLPVPAISKYNEAIDSMADLSRKQLDILEAGIQIPARCFFALTDTAEDIQSQFKEIVEEGKPASPERFFTQWSETVEELTRDTVEKSGFEQTIPRFFHLYADMMESARNRFRDAMVLPYVTHADLKDLEKKMKQAAAPKARAKKE